MDSKDRFRISAFRLGDKEKVGTHETQQIVADLAVKGQADTFSLTVWLNQKTGLPVRRLVSCRTAGGETFKLTENYSKFALDGKIDSQQFKLTD